MISHVQPVLHHHRRGLLIAWSMLGMAVLALAQLCSTIWAFANPMPHHWDNAEYLNQAYRDVWSFRNGGPTLHHKGVLGVWDSLMNEDKQRPPAYRFVSLPFIFWGMRMLPVLRAISLGVFWLSLYVVYRIGVTAIDGPAGKVSGILAAMLVGLYSEIGWSIRVYGTEHTLYFATVLMLLCLAQSTRSQGNRSITWVGLGFALGLGVLSKLSFVLLAGPALSVTVLLIIRGRLPGLSLAKLSGALLIAAVMAWPYYHLHLSQAYGYGREMMQFERHSLHKTGVALLRAWVQLHINEGLGRPASLIVGAMSVLAIVAGFIVPRSRAWLRGTHHSGLQIQTLPEHSEYPGPDRGKKKIGPAGLIILLALAEGMPLLIFQLLFSTSNNVRHVSPVYLPLTLAATVAAGSAGVLIAWWSWGLLIACAIPAFTQVREEYVPMTNYPDEVWDLDALYQIAQQHHLRFPMIGHMGNTSQFCDPTLTYPWEWRGQWANSLWLWRSEEGICDSGKIQKQLADRNVVVTAPDLHMPTSGSMLADPVEKDNAHNTEFAQALLHDPHWELAGKFSTGIINRAEIWVYVRRKVE